MNLNMKTELENVNKHISRLLKSDDALMQEIMDYVVQASGKQLRPCLLMLFSGIEKEAPEAAEFAAIVEIIHMASLVHDDIIDDADTRRGQLSVQKKYGRHMAVYAGDYMLFAAIKNCTVINDRKYQRLFSSLTGLCNGELGQESLRYNPDVTVEKYIHNITGKTATMFELACELGASLSTKKEKIVEAAAVYGKALGILFQIRDDLLDFDFKNQLNKPTSADFVNGIYTMPVIYALQSSETRKEILEVKEQTKDVLTAENAERIIKAVNGAEGFEKTLESARGYLVQAKNALAEIKTKNTRFKEITEEMLDELFGDIRARCERYTTIK